MIDNVNRYEDLTFEELTEEYKHLVTDEDINFEVRCLNWDLGKIEAIWGDYIQYSDDFRDTEPKQEQIEIINTRISYLKTKLLRNQLNFGLTDKNTTNRRTKI
ncbi:hypothetical protein [Burkholderia contaminans]|uniref:hypothetical protein n=1 Tax=Burkholderia contaminans TaxID=488447 RepID=UPI00158A17AC|nr:hypothetical protein [Burkholderia contaminans]